MNKGRVDLIALICTFLGETPSQLLSAGFTPGTSRVLSHQRRSSVALYGGVSHDAPCMNLVFSPLTSSSPRSAAADTICSSSISGAQQVPVPPCSARSPALLSILSPHTTHFKSLCNAMRLVCFPNEYNQSGSQCLFRQGGAAFGCRSQHTSRRLQS